MAKVDISKVEKVYSGKIGCMCGCRGKYSYNEGTKRESWQGAVNVRSVKIIAGKVLNNPDRVEEGNCIFVENKNTNRIFAVYLREV